MDGSMRPTGLRMFPQERSGPPSHLGVATARSVIHRSYAAPGRVISDHQYGDTDANPWSARYHSTESEQIRRSDTTQARTSYRVPHTITCVLG